jgi:alpha-glucoside transport system substrate-binding protein
VNTRQATGRVHALVGAWPTRLGGRYTGALCLLGLLFVGASCGSARSLERTSVEVLGSWTGKEADAFQAVVEPFERRTGVDVEYSATRDLRGTIATRLAEGHPPDLVGLEGPTHLRELANQAVLRDLGDAIDLQTYKASVPPTFVEFGSVNGRLLGVFLKATVKGLIWYNPAVFRRGTPASFADLQWMSEPYLTSETREWCVGLSSKESSGWPGTDLIESFLIQASGVDAYDGWANGRLPWTSPEVRAAFQAYGRVVADDAVYGGAAGALATRFEEAGRPLFADPAGCLFLNQGSFMPAFFGADGYRAGVDFDFFPFPAIADGNEGSVIGGGDLFGMLTDNPAAAELIRDLISPDGQSILVSAGGALSVDRRVSGYPNDLVRREASVLTGAQRFRFDASDLMPAPMNRAFWQAVLDFTADQSQLSPILERLERARLEGD